MLSRMEQLIMNALTGSGTTMHVFELTEQLKQDAFERDLEFGGVAGFFAHKALWLWKIFFEPHVTCTNEWLHCLHGKGFIRCVPNTVMSVQEAHEDFDGIKPWLWTCQ